jgi:hypothetical protein
VPPVRACWNRCFSGSSLPSDSGRGDIVSVFVDGQDRMRPHPASGHFLADLIPCFGFLYGITSTSCSSLSGAIGIPSSVAFCAASLRLLLSASSSACTWSTFMMHSCCEKNWFGPDSRDGATRRDVVLASCHLSSRKRCQASTKTRWETGRQHSCPSYRLESSCTAARVMNAERVM